MQSQGLLLSRSKAGKNAFVPGSMNNFGATIRTSSSSRTIKKESILANEGIVFVEAIGQSGQHRYEHPLKHSPYRAHLKGQRADPRQELHPTLTNRSRPSLEMHEGRQQRLREGVFPKAS